MLVQQRSLHTPKKWKEVEQNNAIELFRLKQNGEKIFMLPQWIISHIFEFITFWTSFELTVVPNFEITPNLKA